MLLALSILSAAGVLACGFLTYRTVMLNVASALGSLPTRFAIPGVFAVAGALSLVLFALALTGASTGPVNSCGYVAVSVFAYGLVMLRAYGRMLAASHEPSDSPGLVEFSEDVTEMILSTPSVATLSIPGSDGQTLVELQLSQN